MANIQINQLTATTTAQNNDFIAIDNGSSTKKITVANFNATGAASAAQSAAAAAQSATDATSAKNAAVQAKDDAQALITSAQTIVSDAQTYANNASTSAGTASTAANTATAQAAIATQAATTAGTYAQNVDSFAKNAKSWAVGGTGTRSGEDTDNSKYYSQQAHDSEINAAASESNASTSETNAAASESTASSAASSASTNALKAEGYAVGTQNGTPAASGETYYHDNAKYYKEQAATSETNAASSEHNAGLSESAAAASQTAAKGSEEDSEAWAWGKIDGVDVPATHPAYHNNAKYYADQAGHATSGVATWNARSGNVVPAAHDYAASQVDFDNTSNSFTATDTQAAIEEVQSNLTTVANGLGTAAAKDVPVSGNASSTQVVMGSDSRLSDARTPVSHTHTKSEITDFPSLGTAAAKDSTNAVTQSSTDLVESGAVYTEVNTLSTGLAKAYKSDDSTETTIADADYIPFYDTSAGTMKKIAVSNLNLGNEIVSNSNDEYSSSKAYSVGDLCIHNNTLYRCITACSAAAWSVNQSCFVADTLTNALNSVNTKSKWVDITNQCQWNAGLTYIRKFAYLRDGEVMFDVSISPIGFISGAMIVMFPIGVKFLTAYVATGLCLNASGVPQSEPFTLANGNNNRNSIIAFKSSNNHYIAFTGIIATEQNS